ncbi:MAG: VWA domain-containing protein, partial [Proteobacteria bacterium]|nr:VWA domain-containing protein [Pseudomonadota bacterium]
MIKKELIPADSDMTFSGTGFSPEGAAGIEGQVPMAIMAGTEEVSRALDDFNAEEYSRIYENDFLTAADDPVSTFSIDVDTASYSNIRRHVLAGSRPPEDAVRIEELINYFDYGYPEVTGEHPFNFNTELSTCPWNEENLLLYVGI